MWVFRTLHVLSVWLVTGVAGMDTNHSQPKDSSYPNLATKKPGAQEPDVYEYVRKGCSNTEFVYRNYTPCGDGYCRCQNNVADCSRHFGKLTYIPALPDNISMLTFVLNKVTAIQHDHFFQNVTNIVSLDLGYNNLSHVSAGAFRSLEKLKELRLYRNNLTYDVLARVLSVQTKLTLLDLTANKDLHTPPDELFHPLSRLQMLCLMGIEMDHLNISVFSRLTELRYLELSVNHLTRAKFILQVLPQLLGLSLAANSFKNFPHTCADYQPFLPNLLLLDLSRNNIFNIPPASVCLPRLQLFKCELCLITHIPTNAFGSHYFPSLQHVAVSIGAIHELPSYIDRYAFNNSRLETIIIYKHGIDFSKDSVHHDSFAGCSHLKELILRGNDFSSVGVRKLQSLFNLHSLLTLGLSSTSIGHISSDMFANLPNLTKLRLDSNKLTVIPDGAFDQLEHLERLDLSSNLMFAIRENTFSPATRQRLKLMDISNNPFKCNCDLMWFRHWLTTQPGLFESRDSYMCDNLPNTTVQSFYVTDQACLWSPAVSKFIIASLILFMVQLSTGALIYRYRWHIRLLLYAVCEAVRGRGSRLNRLRDLNFRYDVFVSCDSEDMDWVRAHLMPELEERLGLRLCLSERDFTPGVSIVHGLEESVQTSKKIMALFSKNFAESQWCQFELRLCLSHVLEHDDNLVVVLLENTASRDLTTAMMAVMKTMTCIEWEDEPEARASFWGRIRIALSEILV